MLAPLFIISGPSASGKSTVLERVLSSAEEPLRLSISATTRLPRRGERDGVDYHFWTRERFEASLKATAFLEWADVFGDFYGTLHSEVTPFRAKGTGVFLNIDVQGAAQVREVCPDAVTVFLRTPDLATLESRLRARATESEGAIQRRLDGARRELDRIGEYQYVVINDDLNNAVNQIRKIVSSHFKRNDNA